MYFLSRFENFWIDEYANLVQKLSHWTQDVPFTGKFSVFVHSKFQASASLWLCMLNSLIEGTSDSHFKTVVFYHFYVNLEAI